MFLPLVYKNWAHEFNVILTQEKNPKPVFIVTLKDLFQCCSKEGVKALPESSHAAHQGLSVQSDT